MRLNANLIALFKFANKNTILDDIYPTMSAFITEEQLKNLHYAVSENHNALVIDATKGKPIFPACTIVVFKQPPIAFVCRRRIRVFFC